MADTALLALDDVETCYGRSQVLFGISLAIQPGEMVTLMGRNGMGKTTTVRSIMGLTPAMAGSIRFGAQEIREAPPYRVAKLGIGLVPEGRQIFPNLTAHENLVATAAVRLAADASAVWSLRALMTNPRLLILDEATEGLAPLIREEIWRCLARLKAEGLAILVIDKNIAALTRIADRHYLIERGRIVWTGSSPN